VASTGAGGTGASSGTGGTGVASGSSGAGGTGSSSGMIVTGMYKTVAVVQSSKAAGAGMMPEHAASLTAYTPHAAGAGTGTIITVDPTKPRQTITGFGAALTEVVASTVAILTPAQQTEIYTKLFAPTENNYTLTRTHIGSCDFALSAYTYDENGGKADPTLAAFSIAQDMDYLIPGLKAANMASNGTLKILGSPWTAPTWMKQPAGSFNNGVLNPMYYGTYAQYLSKYVQAYKAQGLNIWAITPQNEPLIGGPGPREIMTFPLASENTFIKTNLGPQFKTDGLTTKIFAYDHNKGPLPNTDEVLFAKTMFNDPVTSPFVQGLALHWYGDPVQVFETTLDYLHTNFATKDLLFDEGVADGYIFGGKQGSGSQPSTATAAKIAAAWQNDSWFWDANEYDWGWDYSNHVGPYAVVTRYARDLIVGLNHWYTGFIDWTAVLNKWGAQDAQGGGMGSPGPLGPSMYSSTRADPGVSHIENGNPASVMVQEVPAGGTNQTGTIYYSPVYYIMRHVSKYILPGATILQTSLSTMPNGDNTTTQAQTFFATGGHNPDGTTAVVIFNAGMAAVPYSVVVGSQAVDGTIPAQAIQTLVWQ
jgi:glucosylceramidase